MNRRRLMAGAGAFTLVAAGAAGAVAWGRGSSQAYNTAVAATRAGLEDTPATLASIAIETHEPVVAVLVH